MSAYETSLAEAYRLYQQGRLAEAERIGRGLLATGTRDAALHGMLGMIAVQQGRFADGAGHLRPALALSPNNVSLRIALAFALANSARLDEARAIASGTTIPQLERIVAYVDEQQGREADAIARYRRVLAGFPEDAEGWTNLGRLLTRQGEIAGAVEAFGRAIALRGDAAAYLGLAQVLALGERHEERRAALVEGKARHPGDPAILVALGVAEAATGAFEPAERAFRDAIACDPASASGYLEYGMMLESLNRIDDLAALIEAARARSLSGPEIAFLTAWLHRRTNRFADALALAETVGAGINPSRRAQLIGESADRLGQADRAFAAFAEMNRAIATGPAADHARARDFPGEIRATMALATAENAARWDEDDAAKGARAPTFIMGFPRSGTTLLDTLLMNLPAVEVLEETPLIERLETRLGDVGRLAALSRKEAEALRTDYWRMFAELRPDRAEVATAIDKFPMHLVRMPLIHRLFPTAPIIFVERHPCDVVLSCFMARFQTNKATVHFHDIADAARLYDLSMQAWQRAAEAFPLKLHVMRYERMVADLESEMRGLLDFLGFEWTPEVLDNRASAAKRAHIATASYAQVTEPIYARAVGRWERYRTQMAPALDLLAPWAERMGYAI